MAPSLVLRVPLLGPGALSAGDDPRCCGRLRTFWKQQREECVCIFLPFLMVMVILGMNMQAPYLFVRDELQLGIAWMGFVQSSMAISTIGGGLIWQVLVARGWTVELGMPAGSFLAAASNVGVAFSPNIWMFTVCSCGSWVGLEVLYYEGFCTLYNLHVVDCREETNALQTGLRYIGASFGVSAALVVAHLAGTVRASFILMAALCAIKGFVVCFCGTRLKTQRSRLRSEDVSEHHGPHFGESVNSRFAHMFVMSAFTYLLRVSYPMTMNLRSVQDHRITEESTSTSLSLCNAEGVLLMFASPMLMRVEPRPKWSAVSSFMLLSCGHILLGLSSGSEGVLASGALFGLGEAASCGLRGVVVNDLRDGFVERLGRDRARWLYQVNTNLQNVFVLGVNLMIPVIGSYFSMEVVSVTIGLLGAVAALYSLWLPPVANSVSTDRKTKNSQDESL